MTRRTFFSSLLGMVGLSHLIEKRAEIAVFDEDVTYRAIGCKAKLVRPEWHMPCDGRIAFKGAFTNMDFDSAREIACGDRPIPGTDGLRWVYGAAWPDLDKDFGSVWVVEVQYEVEA